MSQNTIKLDKTNFDEEVLTAETPVLVDFWAPWCGPCRMLGPIIDELADDYQGKVKIGKVNVDDNPDLAASFSISSIPTLVLFKDGKEVKKIIGVTPKPQLKTMLDSFL
jgi:thioredoxin 1